MSTFVLYPTLIAVTLWMTGPVLAQSPIIAPASTSVSASTQQPPVMPLPTPLPQVIQGKTETVTSLIGWYSLGSVIGMTGGICEIHYYPNPSGSGCIETRNDVGEVIGISFVPGAAPPVLHQYSTDSIETVPTNGSVSVTPGEIFRQLIGTVTPSLGNNVGMKL